MSETLQDDTEQGPPSLGPGDRLQAARISIGLTQEDVASKMRLSTAILSCLEENNFDDITAPIFVKGYLRSYARIVNLDEEDIIKQYSQYYTQNDPPISSTSNTSPEINSDDARVKGTTWLVIIILVGLLSFWWWSRYQQPAQTVSLDSADSSEILANADDSSESSSISLPAIENDTTESVMQEDIAANSDGDINNSLEISVEEQARNELNSINEILPQPEEIEPVVQTESEADLAPVSEPEPVAAEQGVDTTGSTDLVINVNADTWADIKDADGNRLVYDLLKSGQNITLTGKAPFRAFLGNGHGVSIQYQGENIDLSKNIRADNTARVKIGQ
jgi:cytoskeleton protein RodZ